jgi:uncharacterized coiled-coil DUF342 family protein
MTMSQDEFTKLFKEIQKVNTNLLLHSETSRKEHAEINGAIGELGGQIRDYHQEMIMLACKVDRMERWILQIADKTGIKLSYD